MLELEYLINELRSYNFMISRLEKLKEENEEKDTNELCSFVYRIEKIDELLNKLSEEEKHLIQDVFIKKQTYKRLVLVYAVENKINNYEKAKYLFTNLVNQTLEKMIHE